MFAAVTHALKMCVEDFEVKVENSSETDANDIKRKIELLEKEICKIKKKKAKINF